MQLHTDDTEMLFDKYLEKSFKKTASLMAHSCQAVGCWFFFLLFYFFFFDILLILIFLWHFLKAAVLSQAPAQLCQSAYHYGKNIGLAFQVQQAIVLCCNLKLLILLFPYSLLRLLMIFLTSVQLKNPLVSRLL